MTHKTRRFSELKPARVDSNLFQYHLQKLIRDGYITKLEKGYMLSGAGLYYADRFSGVLKAERPQPKVIVVNIVHNQTRQILLGKKPRQPFLGQYHLPAGKIHEGEELAYAARRELFEKTGIEALPLRYVSLAHVTITQGETIISEYYAAIMTGSYDAQPCEGDWYASDTLPELCPSVAEILSIPLHDPKPFYEWQLYV